MRKSSKRVLVCALPTVTLSGAFFMGLVLPGSATPGANITSTLLARGTVDSSNAVLFHGGKDVVVAQNTFAPGGSSGWHAHPGGAIVVVQQGQITIYKARGARCVVTTYTAGQSFIEQPKDVLNGVNHGTTTAVAYVTFPGVPTAGGARDDVPDPGVCPGA